MKIEVIIRKFTYKGHPYKLTRHNPQVAVSPFKNGLSFIDIDFLERWTFTYTSGSFERGKYHTGLGFDGPDGKFIEVEFLTPKEIHITGDLCKKTWTGIMVLKSRYQRAKFEFPKPRVKRLKMRYPLPQE